MQWIFSKKIFTYDYLSLIISNIKLFLNIFNVFLVFLFLYGARTVPFLTPLFDFCFWFGAGGVAFESFVILLSGSLFNILVCTLFTLLELLTLLELVAKFEQIALLADYD